MQPDIPLLQQTILFSGIEAEELRQSGVKLPILCLGETPEELIPLLLELDVTQMVEDLETGRRLSAAAQRKRAAMTSAARTHTSPERVSRLLRCSSA